MIKITNEYESIEVSQAAKYRLKELSEKLLVYMAKNQKEINDDFVRDFEGDFSWVGVTGDAISDHYFYINLRRKNVVFYKQIYNQGARQKQRWPKKIIPFTETRLNPCKDPDFSGVQYVSSDGRFLIYNKFQCPECGWIHNHTHVFRSTSYGMEERICIGCNLPFGRKITNMGDRVFGEKIISFLFRV